jgi:hypothetical protein
MCERIKIDRDLKEMELEVSDWTRLASDRWWWALLDTVMNILVP